LALSFDAWADGQVAPRVLDIPVMAGKTPRTPEAVSDRLLRELEHPNKEGYLVDVKFSSDGRRLIAGDYPGGVVVVWDVTTGRAERPIETGSGYRGSSDYIQIAPDWETLYVSREGPRYHEQIEQGGKKLFKWEFDGEVRAWDLKTGRLKNTYKQQPPTGVRGMHLAPNGRTFFTLEELPGTVEGRPQSGQFLWDVATGKSRQLAGRVQIYATFSPDGRTIALLDENERSHARAIKLVETATGREKRSIPIADQKAYLVLAGFSPDGCLLAGHYGLPDSPREWNTGPFWLKWWDCATGQEVGSFAGQAPENAYNARFSADGQLLAVAQTESEQMKLLVFRVADKQLVKTIHLGVRKKDERTTASAPIFSPDGKWIALKLQAWPVTRDRELDVTDVQQPRIHLIDATAGEIQETMIAPPSFATTPCFSPDGRILATNGYGKVQLWDMTRPR
jgi:WD40 repeat protein